MLRSLNRFSDHLPLVPTKTSFLLWPLRFFELVLRLLQKSLASRISHVAFYVFDVTFERAEVEEPVLRLSLKAVTQDVLSTRIADKTRAR